MLFGTFNDCHFDHNEHLILPLEKLVMIYNERKLPHLDAIACVLSVEAFQR